MYIYIGAVFFNVETTLYFLKFNNLFVFFSCFCLRPANRLVNVVSVLQRLKIDVVCKPTAREHERIVHIQHFLCSRPVEIEMLGKL